MAVKKLSRREKRELREKKAARAARMEKKAAPAKSPRGLKKGLSRVTVLGEGNNFLAGGKITGVNGDFVEITRPCGSKKVVTSVLADNVVMVTPKGVWVKGSFVLAEFLASASKVKGTTVSFQTEDGTVKVNTTASNPVIERLADEDEDESSEDEDETESSDEDEDEDEKPKKKKKKSDEDDEDEDGESSDEDEDEDEKPKKKKKKKDEDDEDEDGESDSSDDEDEDEKPKKKKKGGDDDSEWDF